MEEVPGKKPSLMLAAAKFITKGPRLRTRAFVPFAALLLWLAARASLLYWGIAIALLGELLRLVASGYLEKGGPHITTSGPYAFCRNPLYLGSTLLGVGLSLAVKPHWLAIAVALLLIVFHRSTIAYEESRLEIRYSEEFLEYRRHVPALIPRPRPWKGAQDARFSWLKLRGNKELSRALWIVVFVASMVLLSWWRPLA